MAADTRPRADSSWVAQPGSQALFLSCPIFEVLYEGTRGSSKTDALVMDYARGVGEGFGASWRGVLFRQSHPELADVIAKALPIDEPVMTPRGFRPIGSLSVGDEITSSDGGTQWVTGVFPQGVKPVFDVRFADGARARACGEHLWAVHLSGRRDPDRVIDTAAVSRALASRAASTSRYAKSGLRRNAGVYVPLPGPCEAPACGLPIDPYLLGLFLGDGCSTGECSSSTSISSWDDETGRFLESRGWVRFPSTPHSWWATGTVGAQFRGFLRDHDLLGRKSWEKFVPERYLRGTSVAQRRALLQGLMDTDGTVGDRNLEFSSTSGRLAEAVVYLVRSLGGLATPYPPRPGTIDGVEHRPSYKVNIRIPEASTLFRLERKRALTTDRPRGYGTMRRRFESIAPDGEAECVCISVSSPDGLFVTRDFVVTHNTKRWYKAIFGEDGCDYNESSSTWKFKAGEELLLRHMRVADDYWSYHGHEYPWMGWEELTNWPDSGPYTRMMSCSRSSRVGMPRRYRATCNPYGRGHNWVKARWQLPQMRGRVIHTPGEPDRIAIHGHLDENLALLRATPNYVQTITAAARNPTELSAWLDGSWDIVSGGMFDDVWQPGLHLVPRFRVPRAWRVNRSLDWGQSHPFSVGWWAQSDGTDLLLPASPARYGLPAREARRMRTVPGDLFRIGEWYGWNGKPNEGLRLTGLAVAEGIRAREVQMGLGGRVMPGPADTGIFDPTPGRPNVAAEMESAGVRWVKADKGPHSRVPGWQAVRAMLEQAADPGRRRPGLFVVEDCAQFLRTFPTLPRSDINPDDVDSLSEDHLGDEVRYRVRWRGGGLGRGGF